MVRLEFFKDEPRDLIDQKALLRKEDAAALLGFQIDVQRTISGLAFKVALCKSRKSLKALWFQVDKDLEILLQSSDDFRQAYFEIQIEFSKMVLEKMASFPSIMLVRLPETPLSNDEQAMIDQIPKTPPFGQAIRVYSRGREEMLKEGASKFLFQINSSLRQEIADLYIDAEGATDGVSKWCYLIDRFCLDIVRGERVG